MNANPETSVNQPASANKLASFGKFWQGMTAGSQDESSQPSSRRTTVSCQAVLPFCVGVTAGLPCLAKLGMAWLVEVHDDNTEFSS